MIHFDISIMNIRILRASTQYSNSIHIHCNTLLAGLEGLLVRPELGGRRRQQLGSATAVGRRSATGLVPAGLPQQRRRRAVPGSGAAGAERGARGRPAQAAGAALFG